MPGIFFGVCQSISNELFVDSSENTFTITAVGNVTPSADGFIACDGAGDYLLIGDHVDLRPEEADFTLEFWVRVVTSPDTVTVFYAKGDDVGAGGNEFVAYFGTSAAHAYSSTDIAVSSAAFELTTWYHLAYVREGNDLTVYVNGVGGTPGDITGLDLDSTSPLTIGQYLTSHTGSDYPLNGLMTCVRFVKGTAVYTADFEIPFAPLTAITNTQLLIQTGVPVADPDDVTAIALWAAADAEAFANNDAVGTFTDQTANTHDFVQATSGEQPLFKTAIMNSKPVVRFDGTDDSMESDLVLGDSEFTVIFAFRLTTLTFAANAYGILLSCHESFVPTALGGFYFGVNETTGVLDQGQFLTGDVTVSNPGIATLAANTPYVISLRSTAGGTRIKINGSLVLNDTTNGYCKAVKPLLLAKNANSNGAAFPLYAPIDFGEVVCYGSAISLADENAVTRKLMTKYGAS